MNLKLLSAAIVAALLSGCGGSDGGGDTPEETPITPPVDNPVIPPIEEPEDPVIPPIEEPENPIEEPEEPVVPPAPDADNDGLSDEVELLHGLDPNDPSDGYYADTDNDMIVNGLEIQYNLDLKNPLDAFIDNDDDGLSNQEELFISTNILNYVANTDGALLDNEGWSNHNTTGNVSFDYIERDGEKFQTLRDLDAGKNPYFKNEFRIPEYIDFLYREGGEYEFNMAFFGDGGFFAFQIPEEDNDSDDRLLIGAGFAPSSEDPSDLSFTIRDHSTVIVSDVFNDDIHKVLYKFNGENSFAGSIYIDGLEIARLDNLFTSSDSFGDGIRLYSGSTSGVSRGFDLSSISLNIGDMKVTNPNNIDTDEDGLTDKEEIDASLDPNDATDGAEIDTDGDGLSNRVEIDEGFDPRDGEDQKGVDSDGDGFTNDQEIEVGSDPFAPNLGSDDDDNDGLSNEIEYEYFFNPNDPSDGYNADADNDGVSNGDEIANNTNPNDHMLQVKDKMTISLRVKDTNNDGDIDEDDDKFDVTFDRYSLRGEKSKIWLFDENEDERYKTMNVEPEVRSFRGRIDDIHDASVFATIWLDCTISYDVFFGYTADPNFKLSADSNYYHTYNYAFDNNGECETTGTSDAKYQRGLKADFERVPYGADSVDSSKESYWPSQGSDFHLFERPQSHQLSFSAVHRYMKSTDLRDSIAYMDYQVNLADQFTTRSFFERISVTDMLIEQSGYGAIDDGSTSADWDANWSEIRSNFWSPRRSENYWFEHVYWNRPDGSTGKAWGERMMNNPTQGGQTTYNHEMGHHYGSGHEAFGERWLGINAMRSIHSTTHSTIIHQGEAGERRNAVRRSGVSQNIDLRLPASDWNIHPLAQPDHASTYRDEAITINVLDNDSDANNERLTVLSVHMDSDFSSKGAKESILSVNPDNTIYFEPPKGFLGLIDAYYVLSDESGYTTRGILHINVEQEGISDIFTFDTGCVPVVDDLRSDFYGSSKESNLSLTNWGYKSRHTEEDGSNSVVDCGTKNINQGVTNNPTDLNIDWSVIQEPFYSGEINLDHTNKDYYHPHLYEINDKDFSVSFWYRPDDTVDLSGYSELARRGRTQLSGWDIDGWVIGSQSDTLKIMIHEKAKTASNSVLTLDVTNRAELLDTNTWVHVAMTLDWENRELKAFINGTKAGEVEIPDNFKLVSTSGSGHTYGRGAYAVFGQATLSSGGTYSTDGNGGFDDLVVAHKALNESEIYDLYMHEFPAFLPSPQNGSSVEIESLTDLSWKKHSNLNMQLKEYRVYLSTEKADVLASNVSTLQTAPLYTNETLDITSLNLSNDDVYYWKVDIVLQDDSIIDGELWSIWKAEDEVAAFSYYEQVVEYKPTLNEENDYENDLHFNVHDYDNHEGHDHSKIIHINDMMK